LVEPFGVCCYRLVAFNASEMNFHVPDHSIEWAEDGSLHVERLSESNPIVGLPKRNSVKRQSASGEDSATHSDLILVASATSRNMPRNSRQHNGPSGAVVLSANRNFDDPSPPLVGPMRQSSCWKYPNLAGIGGNRGA
jgi:hypothetical protein